MRRKQPPIREGPRLAPQPVGMVEERPVGFEFVLVAEVEVAVVQQALSRDQVERLVTGDRGAAGSAQSGRRKVADRQ